MHELAIADSIMKIVLEEISAKKLSTVQAIGLKIGVLSGILPDALEFGFDALKKDTLLENTKLKIEEVPLKGNCSACLNTFFVKDLIFACPECGSPSISIDQGQELDIAYLEVDENGEINEQ